MERGRSIYDWIDALTGEAGAIAPDTISASLLVRILRAAADEGASRTQLLATVGIDPVRLRNPLSRFSSAIALRLFAALEKQRGDPAITLRIANTVSLPNFSDVGYAARLAPNAAAVIDANLRIQSLRQTMFSIIFDGDAKPPALRWVVHPDDVGSYAPVIEYSVASYAHLARQIMGEPLVLNSVDFQHPARFAPEVYEQIFGCPVRFSMPQTRMEMTARQIFRPSPFAEPTLLKAATDRYREPGQWIAKGLRHAGHSYFYLSNQLDKSPPTLDRMASSFGMTERSLRRKLVEEGRPFRQLLDRVRKDMCVLYQMEGRRSLSEIALLLGFSDLSAFSRSYKRWHGHPPSKSDIENGENGGVRSPTG
jgi:AraC-like DNA-binding protein